MMDDSMVQQETRSGATITMNMTLMDELALCGDWFVALQDQLPVLEALERFLVEREKSGPVYPRRGERLNALRLTPLSSVRVLMLAQDPYPGEDNGEPNAMGLALSVRKGVKIPASLRNIYKELSKSTPFQAAGHGDLSAWSRQGVLLWNVVLTLDAGVSKSHERAGWESFTQAVVRLIAEQDRNVVFLSLGRDSHAYAPILEAAGKSVIKTSHPSPLGATKSAKDGTFPSFMGSNCFVKVNEYLTASGLTPVDWSLDETS